MNYRIEPPEATPLLNELAALCRQDPQIFICMSPADARRTRNMADDHPTIETTPIVRAIDEALRQRDASEDLMTHIYIQMSPADALRMRKLADAHPTVEARRIVRAIDAALRRHGASEELMNALGAAEKPPKTLDSDKLSQ